MFYVSEDAIFKGWLYQLNRLQFKRVKRDQIGRNQILKKIWLNIKVTIIIFLQVVTVL